MYTLFPVTAVPPEPASTQHTLYLIAEDTLPNYKGWTSSCAAPVVDQSTPPSPCQPVTINLCNNTHNPAIPDNVPNVQVPPYFTVTRPESNTDPPPPPLQPVLTVVTVPDSPVIAFTWAEVKSSTTSTITFSFKVSWLLTRVSHDPYLMVMQSFAPACHVLRQS
jgi:hypothetical protein